MNNMSKFIEKELTFIASLILQVLALKIIRMLRKYGNSLK